MKKTLIGLGSFIPFVTMMATAVICFSAMFKDNDSPEVIAAMIMSFVTVISCYAYIIGFIIHAVKNKEFSSNQKLIWAIVLYFLNVFAFPVYFFKYVKN